MVIQRGTLDLLRASRQTYSAEWRRTTKNSLIQYCKGAAKDAIENSLMLPTEEGYKEAKEILHKNFGQKHIIVRAFVDKVVKGP